MAETPEEQERRQRKEAAERRAREEVEQALGTTFTQRHSASRPSVDADPHSDLRSPSAVREGGDDCSQLGRSLFFCWSNAGGAITLCRL